MVGQIPDRSNGFYAPLAAIRVGHADEAGIVAAS